MKTNLIKKVLKWLNWTLLLPLLVVVLLLVILLYTPTGLKLGVWLGHKYVPQLAVAEHSGSLLGGMTLNDIRWQNDTSNIQLTQLQLDIDSGCLFQLKVCISDLTINDGMAQFGTNTVRFARFNTAIEAWGRQLQLNDSLLQQLQIELAPGSEPTTEPFRYQPPKLTDITLPISVFINGFSLTDASLLQQDQQTALPDVSFSLQAREQNIRLLDLQASHPLVNLSAVADITLQGSYPLSGRLSAVLQQAPLTEQQLNLGLSGSLADLVVTARATGTINANAEAELALLTAELPLNVNLQYDAFSWPPEESEAWQLSGGEITASGDLQQLEFNVDAGVAHRTVPPTELSAGGQFQLAESLLTISRFNIKTLDGTIAGNARLELAPALSWQAQLKLDAIKPATFWPSLDGELSGELSGELANSGSFSSDGSWQTEVSQLTVDGSLRDEIINVSGNVTASFSKPSGRYQFSSDQLIFEHGVNQISLTGSLAEQWQLDAKVAVADLSSSLPSASGELNADISVRGAQRKPELSASIDGNTLRYGADTLEQLTVELQLQLAEQLQAKIEVVASDGRVLGNKLKQLTLEASGNENQHQFSLALQSPLSNINLELSGQLTDRNRWQGQLSSADLGSPLGTWQLQQTVDLLYLHEKQQLNISQHCWLQSPGSLCLTSDASLSAQSMAVNIELRQLDLASLNEFMPLAVRVSGELSANASANWQPGQSPFVELSVQSRSGALTEQTNPPIELNWRQLTLTSVLENDQLSANLQATLNEQAQLSAELGISDISTATRPLSGRLQLSDFTLAFLEPILDEYSELAGVLSADITADGSVESPMLAGQLALQQLRVKGKLAPTDINDGTLQVNFKGEQADLQGDIITPQGQLSLTGQADWQQLDDWRARLTVKGDPLSIQIEQGKLQVKPDLEITASPALTKVSGKIDIPSAQLSIDELPPNAIGLSNDTVILNAEREPITEQQATAIPLEANIRVELGEKVQLEAFGLETLLRGGLQVRQKQNKQTINGEVRLVDGTFRSYGQDLLIRKGKMTFSGPPDQPYLNVEAIRNPANMEDNVIAGIRVTGPADRPQINIFSEPAMPQANALSYLLVGRDLDSESGSAANAVTTSLIGMSIASSGSLVGEIGEAFGVSDLTLDTAGSGDSSQVTVSGYLNRDLQIKYGIGIFEPIGEFTLRYRLMQSLYLEAVSGLDNAVDILYRFEFD
ncbi:autotransporter secretion inner membrane protein TamB [Arsukibacterium tuosuense]|uniref:Autotransporter secretion inner membrane protein TamB n=1 Tax=Arsukibacterium tuosuense TaxID=1323745 RepID=A0A285IVX4_9GAMM|nr:translocation/assembly module TamB domain-containing protein [Arsukibacterium tuosuense]SNY51081.1 autotransporter secretion inner membrane protein TamB [Arsukibacterium tuosuense]